MFDFVDRVSNEIFNDNDGTFNALCLSCQEMESIQDSVGPVFATERKDSTSNHKCVSHQIIHNIVKSFRSGSICCCSAHLAFFNKMESTKE